MLLLQQLLLLLLRLLLLLLLTLLLLRLLLVVLLLSLNGFYVASGFRAAGLCDTAFILPPPLLLQLLTLAQHVYHCIELF